MILIKSLPARTATILGNRRWDLKRIALLVTKERAENQVFQDSLEALRANGFDPTVSFLDDLDDPRHHLRSIKSSGIERALVCGGDGTLHHIVGTVATLPKSERVAIAALPLGTANDFAHTAGYGQEGFSGAVLYSARAPLHAIDVGWVNGRAFVNVVTGGAVTKNTTDVSPRLKSALGKFAYAITALTNASDRNRYHIFIRGDGWTHQANCFAFAVGNNSTAGGGFKIAPRAKLNDGALDLLVIPDQDLLSLAALAAELYSDAPDLSRHRVFYRQASEFLIDSAEEMQINLDGEPLTGRQFKFTIEPSAIEMPISDERLITPRP